MYFAQLQSRVLYFFYMPGCDACAEAHPIVEEFTRKHGLDYSVLHCDITKMDWKISGFEPKGTPSYLIVINREPVASYFGPPLSLEDLEKFVTGQLQQNAKRGRRG